MVTRLCTLLVLCIHAKFNVYVDVVMRNHLSSKVRDDNEFLEDILWEYVSEACLLDVVRGDVDVVGPEVKISGRDGPHSPLCLRGEGSSLVV